MTKLEITEAIVALTQLLEISHKMNLEGLKKETQVKLIALLNLL